MPELIKMTETTIELALIAPSLNSSPETAGPGNIEICGDEPLEKSLEEAANKYPG